MSKKYDEDEGDTTNGGFFSGHDCVSSEEGESDLSSVSEIERETEDLSPCQVVKWLFII